jgi:broad specificity phosphatase PhoE
MGAIRQQSRQTQPREQLKDAIQSSLSLVTPLCQDSQLTSPVGRHGEGYHNVAEAFYGTEAWDASHTSPPHPQHSNKRQCYWSLQDGNGTSTWADALLTSEGIAQAQKAHAFWANQISTQHIPTPESYYSSPLTRCLDTAYHTFSGLTLPEDRPFIPVIKELFREVIGVHTCDRRSGKSFIANRYPNWKIEDGFSEEDPLWKASERESNAGQDVRSRKVLDDVFEHDRNTWISVSSHSGEIGSLLRGE